MIYQASFKGLLLPKGERKLLAKDNGATYQVQVFEDWTGSSKTSRYRARLVGGGRLDVSAAGPEKAKVLVEGQFKERVSEWEQVG